jgi:hypothetical protein
MRDSFGAPLTERDVIELEHRLGVSLPSDYVAFLREHNGGTPLSNVFPIFGFPLDRQGVLALFFGVMRGGPSDLISGAEAFDNRVPPELLPVGSDVFGNLICLAILGPNRGKVYWWFHEEEADEGESPSYDNVYFVADSFTDLLNSLTKLVEEGDA